MWLNLLLRHSERLAVGNSLFDQYCRKRKLKWFFLFFFISSFLKVIICCCLSSYLLLPLFLKTGTGPQTHSAHAKANLPRWLCPSILFDRSLSASLFQLCKHRNPRLRIAQRGLDLSSRRERRDTVGHKQTLPLNFCRDHPTFSQLRAENGSAVPRHLLPWLVMLQPKTKSYGFTLRNKVEHAMWKAHVSM